jgi:hypothetical protein
LIDCLLFYVVLGARESFTHLHGDFTIAGEGLQNLGHSYQVCSELIGFDKVDIFIVPHLL